MLNEGQRVRLKPTEDQPEAWGVVIGEYRHKGLYLVELDTVFWNKEDCDDGLREVDEGALAPCSGDQIEVKGVRCGCDLCRLVSCGHVAGKFDMECPECRLPVLP